MFIKAGSLSLWMVFVKHPHHMEQHSHQPLGRVGKLVLPACSPPPLTVIKMISAELPEFQHEAETFVSFSHLLKQEEKSAVIFSQCSNYSKQNQSLDFLKAPQEANYFMFNQMFHSSFRFYRFYFIYCRKAPTLESVVNNDSFCLPLTCQADSKLREEEKRALRYLETRRDCNSVQAVSSHITTGQLEQQSEGQTFFKPLLQKVTRGQH